MPNLLPGGYWALLVIFVAMLLMVAIGCWLSRGDCD
jgi:hypothetical protein